MKPFVFTLLFVAAIPTAAVLAQDASRTQRETATQERIYGSQLMTQQERNEYRARMRAAKTAEERERIRAEHHAAMQARAKERGVTLPEEPPARGRGTAPGRGRRY